MPWKVTGPPWYVVNKITGARMNKRPHPNKPAALAHQRALYANAKPSEKG